MPAPPTVVSPAADDVVIAASAPEIGRMVDGKAIEFGEQRPDPAGSVVAIGDLPPDVTDRCALLVGAEGPGLTERAMWSSDVRVRIPMSRGTDSLNVATAAALAFYERARDH